MKNIVYLIIDSLNFSHIKETDYSAMPYLKSLSENNVYFENMYSQAPYTEAAVMSLYCGQSVLSDGGYLFRFKNARKTVFEAMKEKGYTTFYNSMQPQCYPSSLFRGIDFVYNNVGYDAAPLWGYRLYLYSDLYKSNKLTENDRKKVELMLDDNFTVWQRFIENYKNKDLSLEMIIDNSASFDADRVEAELLREIKAYNSDKNEYIDDLLSKGKNHPLFKIPTFFQNNKIKDRVVAKEISEEYLPLFKEIDKKHRKLNLKNCKGVFKGPKTKLLELFKHPNILTLKNFVKSLILAKNVFKDADLFGRIREDYDSFKNAPSIKTHIDHYINWEKNREDSKPSFACIHVDDVHNPEMIFSYDTEDREILKKEFDDMKSVLDNLPDDYYGNITHDLSLKYIDGKIKYLYDKLEENGLKQNTVVLICADHGFSFSGNPLRDSFVINMFLENYNIPCVITGIDRKIKYEQLSASKDIPAMLCFIADGNVPPEFEGKNQLEGENAYKYDFIEYCGGGCPDLDHREIKLGCFDGDYFIATLSKLRDKTTLEECTEIYDLKNDPRQLNNLKGKNFDEKKVNEMLFAIADRKKEILSKAI